MTTKRIENKERNHWINLCSWNARSLSEDKIKLLQLRDEEIVCVQETWIPHMEFGIENYGLKTRTGKRDGGSLMFLNNHCGFIHKMFDINKDCRLYRLILAGNCILWLANVYLNRGVCQQVTKLFCKLREHIPSCEMGNFIAIGDFNLDPLSEDRKAAMGKMLAKQMNMWVVAPDGATRLNRTIDFMLVGEMIEVRNVETEFAPSDHKRLKV